MNVKKLNKAIREAQRFIRTAKEAKERLEADRYASITGSAETGAAKRASMDLSRSLVELRRPG